MARTRLSKVTITPKGTWGVAVQYKRLDVVNYNGSGWLAIQDNAGVTPSEGNTWTLMAEKGSEATVTTDNITAALGYTPANAADLDITEAAVGELIVNSSEVPWQTVMALVDAGVAPKCFPVGTVFKVASKTYTWMYFVVVAHDHHKNPNNPNAHTMTLLQQDVIYGRQFDNSEYLWVNTGTTELPVGTYNIIAYKSSYSESTVEDGTFQIATTKAIPVGGAIRHTTMGAWRSAYSKESVLAGKWTTYDADGNVLESGLACTEGNDGTNLGTTSVREANMVHAIGRFNSTQRNAYGSNRWETSNIRQWLNSDAAAKAWWTKQTIFDTRASYDGTAGYLADLDADFVAVLGEVDNVTKRNTVYEVDGVLGGSYTTRDKVFLASRDELGFGIENSIAEGSVLEYYDGATNTDRIKYDISSKSTARLWWVRSPHPWISCNARIVLTSGALGHGGASNGFGCVAACVIYNPKS